MPDPDNALHTTLRIVWISGVALGALWVTATQFDETEIKAWAPMLAAVVSTEWFRKRQAVRAKREKESQFESRKGHVLPDIEYKELPDRVKEAVSQMLRDRVGKG